jgi:hypothetical protein
VVVNDLNVEGISRAPAEADPPSLVHANAVLSGSATTELLKAVPGRYSQIIQALRRIQHEQLSTGELLDILAEPSGPSPIEQPLCVPIRETSDHAE